MPPIDEAESHRFVLITDGLESQLVYRAEDGRLDLFHTEVPDELGGRGLASQLVSAAVARAAGSGEIVVPSCPYVRSWLRKHPDQAERVSIDWGTDES